MAQTWDKQLDTLTPPQRQQMDAALDALGLWQPDWNRVFRLGNDYWNDVLLDDSAMSADEQRAHWAEVVQRQNDLSHYDDAVGSGGWMIPKKGETRDAYSDQVGLHLLAVTAANVKMYRDQTDRLGNVELDWTEVAVNLVLYRRERGSYPQRLDELVPVYMNHLPPIVPDYPIHYEIQGNGCVLERDFPPATNPASAAATRPTTLPVLNGNFIVRLP